MHHEQLGSFTLKASLLLSIFHIGSKLLNANLNPSHDFVSDYRSDSKWFWLNLICNQTHRKHSLYAYKIAIALPIRAGSLLTDRSRVCYFTLISAAQDVAHRALGFTQVDAEWRMHLKRIYDAIYAAREDCKLSSLSWAHLEPLSFLLDSLSTDFQPADRVNSQDLQSNLKRGQSHASRDSCKSLAFK